MSPTYVPQTPKLHSALPWLGTRFPEVSLLVYIGVPPSKSIRGIINKSLFKCCHPPILLSNDPPNLLPLVVRHVLFGNTFPSLPILSPLQPHCIPLPSPHLCLSHTNPLQPLFHPITRFLRISNTCSSDFSHPDPSTDSKLTPHLGLCTPHLPCKFRPLASTTPQPPILASQSLSPISIFRGHGPTAGRLTPNRPRHLPDGGLRDLDSPLALATQNSPMYHPSRPAATPPLFSASPADASTHPRPSRPGDTPPVTPGLRTGVWARGPAMIADLDAIIPRSRFHLERAATTDYHQAYCALGPRPGCSGWPRVNRSGLNLRGFTGGLVERPGWGRVGSHVGGSMGDMGAQRCVRARAVRGPSGRERSE